MKYLLLILTLTLFISCTEEKKDQVQNPQKNQQIQKIQEAEVPSGIAEENDMCICTKDYRPVCGENGVTYPNPCQATCDKVKRFEEGACPDAGIDK